MFFISVGDINNEDASANGFVVWDPLHGMRGEDTDLPGGRDAVLWAHQGIGGRGNGENNVDKLWNTFKESWGKWIRSLFLVFYRGKIDWHNVYK